MCARICVCVCMCVHGCWVGYTEILVNPLITDDAFWRRQFLATCYQLVQSVLKIGSALAERVGQVEVGGCTPLADSAWRQYQVGHLSAFLYKRA